MKKSCVFSVVIPLYNKADTIRRALRSVAAQKFRDFEVVVVDDGSRDVSARIVEDFMGIERLRVVCQENAGVSAARNRGVREAAGEYVAFLDADDCWHPDHLVELARIVEKFPDSVFIGSGFHWHIGGKVLKTRETGRIEKVDLISEIALFQPIHTSSMAVRRKEFLAIGGFDERHGYFEDVELMLKLALKHPNHVALSRRALVRHLDDAASSITKECSVERRDSPHLELLNRLAGEGNPPPSVRRFAQQMVLKTFSNNSFRFKAMENIAWAKTYPGLTQLCYFGRIFTAPKWQLLAWPLAVVLKVWYWLELRRVLARVK